MSNPLSEPPQTDPVQILRYRDRQYAAELIAVLLLKFDFFTWLHTRNGATTSEIMAQFELAERPCDVALTLCRANNFISSSDGFHEMTILGREHLVKGSPWFLGPYYKPIQDTPIVETFLNVFKSGKPAQWQAREDGDDWHESMMDEQFAQDFTDLMNSRGIAFGQALAQGLIPKIQDKKTLLDVGGGSGIYSATLVSKFPHLKATVLEQKPVDAIAKKEINNHGLTDRIEVLTGDMFRDPWPQNPDILLFSNVLHDWDFPEVEALIKKAASCLDSGGLLVIHEAFLNNDKSGPLAVAEYSALLMNITQGKCYSPREYGEILENYSFEAGPYHHTLADRGFMTAIKK